jgi:tetratricopeptide (TPR) repeat protein
MMIAAAPGLAFAPTNASEVTIVVGAPGAARARALKEWLARAQAAGATGYFIPCALSSNGPLGGPRGWIEDLLPTILDAAPELIAQHAGELRRFLPRLGQALTPAQRRRADHWPRHPDGAMAWPSGEDQSADRADRILCGVIDLLAAWHARTPSVPWVIAADGFEQADSITQRFFAQLVRRRGRELRLRLILTAAPDQATALAERLAAVTPTRIVELDGATASPGPSLSPSAARQAARILAKRLRGDEVEAELWLPRLIALWEASDQPRKALPWVARAVDHYSRGSFPAIALLYEGKLRGRLDEIRRTDWPLYRRTVAALSFAYATTGRSKEAIDLLSEVTASLRPGGFPPYDGILLYAQGAELYLGHLPPKHQDVDQAERYLRLAREVLMQFPPEVDEKAWYRLDGHLSHVEALVAYRQQRYADAEALTWKSLATVNRYYPPDHQPVERAVRYHALAQITTAQGRHRLALGFVDRALAEDPDCSAYHHDRGQFLVALGRPDEAARAFRLAHQAGSSTGCTTSTDW